ncbi:MAG: ATP phosphoribosyltransferase, partial [Clostridia bacterium]|nr:ATP phosphoribosyltransferase [Clostridia bacterium]
KLSKLGSSTDAIAERVLEAGGEVVLAKVKSNLAGVVGKDTIMEMGRSLYECLDLGFGKCRFALACKKDFDFFGGYGHRIVASKYPNVTKEFFRTRGLDVEVVKIDGSVELAPLLGLADGIVDIVETGSTLKENGLEVVCDVAPISARLIVNPASLKLKKNGIDKIIDSIAQVI